MTTEGVKRKLTAIFSADVKGYSRLMREGEVATVDTLKAYREVISALIQKHRGRVVDTPGDNVLAEFGSVVDAVQCTVEVQQELKGHNAQLSENRRMEFRIGVNLGDVIEEGERIYGDGLNVAARVEGLADAGGICISGTAFDQVRNKLSVGYEYLGEQTVKNIPEPVRAYRVLMEPEAAGKVIGEKRPRPIKWPRTAIAAFILLVIVAGALAIWNFYLRPPSIEPASVERMAYPLPDKPSIAVLPFDNLSGDPEQEYFSDGLTEEIITALSKTRQMFVIARNSTFSYKGNPVKIQQVAEELGVRYVLEGSIRKSENRVRITAQLIDAITGRHLWAERYDRELKDLFALQDEITVKILKGLQVKLTGGLYDSVTEKGTNNLEAYLKLLRAREYGQRWTKEGNAMARQLAEDAIALDPGYAMAHLRLSATHLMDLMYGSSESPKQSLRLAEELVQKALALDANLAEAHAFLGRIYLTKRQYEKAIAEGERAVVLQPNSDFAHAALAFTLRNAGRHEEAIALLKKAIRLNPFPRPWYLFSLGYAHFVLGQYEEAAAEFGKALQRAPESLFAHLGLAATYSEMGREQDAQAEATEILRIDPKFTLESHAKGLLFKNKDEKERYIAALRKAGLPEHPPLALPDKPSIAVLPFVNMSEDPKQEYFSDGLTEEIITALSRIPKLFVIAWNSSFAYKGKAVNVQKVSRELGVKYVLEGSVRRSENQLRITAQLIDATTGHHLWAERYDRELKEIFALQDDITKEVMTALQVKLTPGEHARGYGKGTDKREAYLRLLQGREHYRRGTKEDNILARRIFEEVIALDPKYAIAYRFLSGTHHADLAFGTSKSPKQSIARAIELAKRAITIDDSLAEAHGFLGFLYTLTGQYEKGIEEAERAVALDPNSADAHIQLGAVLHNAGRREEAIPIIKRAIRLNPFPPLIYFLQLGETYRSLGRYEEAIAAYKMALQRNPDFLGAHITLAAIYSMTGKKEQAREAAEEVLRIDPNFSLDSFAKRRKKLIRDNKTEMKLFIDALRKAGLK